MNDNLWYQFDFEHGTCDICATHSYCTVWRKDKSDKFMVVCGFCDKDWRLTNAKQ